MLSADNHPDHHTRMRGPNPFAALDPQALELGLHRLLRTYQESRSALQAWLIVRYAEALCRHPDPEVGDEQRCRCHRLAGQWRWLAANIRSDA